VLPAKCGQTSSSSTTAALLYVLLNEPLSDAYGDSGPASPPNLMAFTVRGDGSLQPVPGYPCQGYVLDLDVNPLTRTLYLAGGQVASYSVASNGAISQTSVLNPPSAGSSPGEFFAFTLDPALRNGYTSIFLGAGHFTGERFQVNPDGTLIDAGSLADPWGAKYYFTPDGSVAYGALCYKGMSLVGLHVAADGSLQDFDPHATMPPLAPNGLVGCAVNAAISPDGTYLVSHFFGSYQSQGKAWLGGFHVNSDGTLSQMAGSPQAESQIGNDVVWDPSGKYLVAAEHDGVHVYAFEPATGPSHLAGPIGTGGMSNVRFNKSGTLLFASSISDESVSVFLWNNGVLTPAPGSPYAVAGRAGRMVFVE
jgi:WD40 repeat protein